MTIQKGTYLKLSGDEFAIVTESAAFGSRSVKIAVFELDWETQTTSVSDEFYMPIGCGQRVSMNTVVKYFVEFFDCETYEIADIEEMVKNPFDDIWCSGKIIDDEATASIFNFS